LALKGNHSKLHDEVAEFLQENKDKSYCNKNQDIDCGHGRIDTRNCFATEEIDWLGILKFPGQKSIFCIESTREIGKQLSTEIRYYISSLSANSVKLNSATRSHWAIENLLHWTLDMTSNEDYSRIRLKNAAENMAMIRHTALNLLKIAKHKFKKYISMNGLRKKAGWDDDTLHIIIRQ
jgi:predicted transposase YbfD/YdcC